MNTDKVILLTGASSGIGYDTAIALARQGYKVYAAARRLDRMEPLRQYGVVPLKMDVTDEQSMQAGVQTILDEEGRIDVLVNNAGYGYFGAVENVPMDDARNQLEVNIFGLARLCQLVLPAMRAQHSGRIINTSSVAGKSVFYYGGWYHVSKYAVEALSDAMRMELKPFGIDVVIIEPGAIKTNWGLIAADHLEETSKGTAYEESGTMMAHNLRNMYLSSAISDPAVVRRAICRAVNAKHPCTRYRIGRMASAIVFFHWLLPARWWDSLLRLMGKHLRLFTMLLLAFFASGSMYGAIPSTPLAYYSPSSSLNMTRSGNGDPNDEPYTVIQTEAGRECVYVPSSKYLYFRIDKTAVPSTMDTLVFKVTYLDRGTGELRMQYNATGNRNYESCVVGKTGSEQWITVTMAVTDASLRNAQNHGDIRFSEDNYIARVEVYNGTLNPLTEPVCQHAGGSAWSEFIGKSVAGYQAWFRVAGQYEFWHHWGNDAVGADGTRWPRPNNHTFEIYPDISFYEDADLAQTGFADLGNGEPARLYNGASPAVIAQHFSLMQQHGIDGVAVQRFIGPEMRTVADNPAATLHSIRQKAEDNQRLFYICYDITSNGLESTWADLIRFDWVYNIEQNYALTQSPAYATVNGKPVVQVWGTGFTDNHPGTAAETIALIEWLKSRGCYVIGGVPTYWRENRNDAKGPSQPDPANQESFEEVYKHYDMLSPWLVGRFSNLSEAQYFFALQRQDKHYCDSLHIGYMPTLFPGFGWATWNTGVPNQAPRQAGEFLWAQAKNIRETGCTNMYFAMFDEYDEGTALLSAATDYSMLPTDAYFLTTSADGRWLSADFYLRLTGDAARMLKGTKDTALTTPHSLGPVFYRNSFESRTTPYNYVNNVPQNTGTFPIDPCCFLPRQLFGTNVSDTKCEIVQSSARTGGYALAVSGTASGNAVYQYRFSKTAIEVTRPMRLTAFRAASGIGSSVQIMLSMRSGQTITTTVDSIDGSFERLVAYIPQSFAGDVIDALSVTLNTSETGAFNAIIDDILIEEYTRQEAGIEGSSPSQPEIENRKFDILGRPVSADFQGIIITPSGKYLVIVRD